MTGSNRFEALDSWRGVCALLVATMHLCTQFHYSALSDLAIVSNFYLLVDFLLVLSGFVIAHAYHDHLANGGSFLRFVIRRVGRLWPLHVAMFLVMFLLETTKALASIDTQSPAFGPGWEPASVAANFFLLHALGVLPFPNINGPSWTISAELWTNILFAVIVMRVGRHAPAVLGGLAVVSVIVLIAFTDGHFLDATTDFGLFRCIYGFTVGFFLYRLWRSRAAKPQSAGLEWPALFLAGAFMWLSDWKPLTMLAPFVFGFVIYAFARQSGALSRLMTGGAMGCIGLWSYSIYLVHWPLFVFLSRFMGFVDATTGADVKADYMIDGESISLVSFSSISIQVLTVLVPLLLLIPLSSVSYKLIESPGRTWFNRWASGEIGFKQAFRSRAKAADSKARRIR